MSIGAQRNSNLRICRYERCVPKRKTAENLILHSIALNRVECNFKDLSELACRLHAAPCLELAFGRIACRNPNRGSSRSARSVASMVPRGGTPLTIEESNRRRTGSNLPSWLAVLRSGSLPRERNRRSVGPSQENDLRALAPDCETDRMKHLGDIGEANRIPALPLRSALYGSPGIHFQSVVH